MAFGKNVAKGCLIVAGTYFALNTINWAVIGIGRYLDDVRFSVDIFREETSPFEIYHDGFIDALRGIKWYGAEIINHFKNG